MQNTFEQGPCAAIVRVAKNANTTNSKMKGDARAKTAKISNHNMHNEGEKLVANSTPFVCTRIPALDAGLTLPSSAHAQAMSWWPESYSKSDECETMEETLAAVVYIGRDISFVGLATTGTRASNFKICDSKLLPYRANYASCTKTRLFFSFFFHGSGTDRTHNHLDITNCGSRSDKHNGKKCAVAHGIDEAEVEAHENTQTLVTVKGRKNGHQQIVDHAPQSEASDRDTLLEMDRGKLAFKVLAGKLGGERAGKYKDGDTCSNNHNDHELKVDNTDVIESGPDTAGDRSKQIPEFSNTLTQKVLDEDLTIDELMNEVAAILRRDCGSTHDLKTAFCGSEDEDDEETDIHEAIIARRYKGF
ncbi:hypothetical protein ACO0RG_002331 [Hanseniaspora osmophila]